MGATISARSENIFNLFATLQNQPASTYSEIYSIPVSVNGMLVFVCTFAMGGGEGANIFCRCHMCEGKGYAHPQENASVIDIKLMFDKLTYTFD